MKKRNTYEYESIYEDNFTIAYDYYENGSLVKEKELLIFYEPGKTNKTKNDPDDLLQIAIKCKPCESFMDFVNGKGWCNGKYICPICNRSISEKEVLERTISESVTMSDEFIDIYEN